MGHFEGDPQAYREDLEGVPGRDPIPTYEAALSEAGVLDADSIAGIRDEAQRRVESAISFAKGSVEPAAATATELVFA